MALEELQVEGYPLIQRIDGGWVEVRMFTTTNETEIHAILRGSFAAPLGFTETTYPLRVKDLVYRRRSSKDAGTNTLRWDVEITATDLASILSGNPDQSELEEVESDSSAQFDSSGTLQFLERIKKTTYVTVGTQADLNLVYQEKNKIGLINASANNPFAGTEAEQWRCVNVKTQRTGANLNKLEMVYFYERAPRDDSGSFQTWTDWGGDQSPAVTYSTGDISPLRL